MLHSVVTLIGTPGECIVIQYGGLKSPCSQVYNVELLRIVVDLYISSMFIADVIGCNMRHSIRNVSAQHHH